jgi:hypothetical protein
MTCSHARPNPECGKNDRKSRMNRRIMEEQGFQEELSFVDSGRCPNCKKEIGTFRDLPSKAEFHISGLCQECQDGFFTNCPSEKFCDPRLEIYVAASHAKDKFIVIK